MGIIKETVDFFVIPGGLTAIEQDRISAYIRSEKEKELRKQTNRARRNTKVKTTSRSK